MYLVIIFTKKSDCLYDCNIQIEELLRTKILDDQDESDLMDLKNSIESDFKSQNIELLSSLLETAKEAIKEKSQKVYAHAKKNLV